MNTFYVRTKELAYARNISMAQLERTLGFANGVISTWKKGNARIFNLVKVADYFEITLDYLVGREVKPSFKAHEVLPK